MVAHPHQAIQHERTIAFGPRSLAATGFTGAGRAGDAVSFLNRPLPVFVVAGVVLSLTLTSLPREGVVGFALVLGVESGDVFDILTTLAVLPLPRGTLSFLADLVALAFGRAPFRLAAGMAPGARFVSLTFSRPPAF